MLIASKSMEYLLGINRSAIASDLVLEEPFSSFSVFIRSLVSCLLGECDEQGDWGAIKSPECNIFDALRGVEGDIANSMRRSYFL